MHEYGENKAKIAANISNFQEIQRNYRYNCVCLHHSRACGNDVEVVLRGMRCLVDLGGIFVEFPRVRGNVDSCLRGNDGVFSWALG